VIGERVYSERRGREFTVRGEVSEFTVRGEVRDFTVRGEVRDFTYAPRREREEPDPTCIILRHACM
jgi:hypothetical protein